MVSQYGFKSILYQMAPADKRSLFYPPTIRPLRHGQVSNELPKSHKKTVCQIADSCSLDECHPKDVKLQLHHRGRTHF